MPRKKETIVDVATETKAVETKSTKQSTANKTAKTAKSVSPSLPSKTTVAAKAITPALAPKPKKQAQPKPKTISRIELAHEVAKAVGQYMEITNRHAEMIVAEIINSMIDSLKEGNEIEIRGFGAFRIRSRNARNGRNPKTGEAVAVPSKSVVYFKIGKGLKEKFVER
ncbi:MAG: HU family DNA-binding protein [Blastocatellia bacterium]